MRIVMIIGTLIALTLVGVRPSSAIYEGPWCAHVSIGPGSMADRCDMRSFAMCIQEISGQGHCTQNPRYMGTGETPLRRKAKRSR